MCCPPKTPTFRDIGRTLARNVRLILKAAQITATRLSVLAGLDRSHVRVILQGKRGNLGAHTLTSIAAVAGVSLDWLVRGEGEPPPAERILAAVSHAATQTTRPRRARRTARCP
jgi:transcriptional regulator with XRE-family HTH domain